MCFIKSAVWYLFIVTGQAKTCWFMQREQKAEAAFTFHKSGDRPVGAKLQKSTESLCLLVTLLENWSLKNKENYVYYNK